MFNRNGLIANIMWIYKCEAETCRI